MRLVLAGITTLAGNGALLGLLEIIGNVPSDTGFDYQSDMRTFPFPLSVGVSKSNVPRMRSLNNTFIWAPEANLALYGETVDVTHMITNGVRVALSTDRSYSGSSTCSSHFDAHDTFRGLDGMTAYRHTICGAWRTEHSAYVFNLEHTIGTLKPRLAADFAIVRSRSDAPYSDLVSAEVSDLIATLVDSELETRPRSAFRANELPIHRSNAIVDHFVCGDISERDFT